VPVLWIFPMRVSRWGATPIAIPIPRARAIGGLKGVNLSDDLSHHRGSDRGDAQEQRRQGENWRPAVGVVEADAAGSPPPTALSPKEAVELQRELAARVVLQPLPRRINVLGAADLAYLRATDELIAVVLTFSWPELEPLETIAVRQPARFPYVPGLLSFRELPALLAAYRQIQNPPQVFLCDAQGLAHPRRFGLACHLGVVLELPTVGCAKSRLCGDHEPFVWERGNHRPLKLNGLTVGSVFCSRSGVKPIYISPGHLADVDSSRELIAACRGRFRIPEPLRLAHLTATRLRRERTAATKAGATNGETG